MTFAVPLNVSVFILAIHGTQFAVGFVRKVCLACFKRPEAMSTAGKNTVEGVPFVFLVFLYGKRSLFFLHSKPT